MYRRFGQYPCVRLYVLALPTWCVAFVHDAIIDATYLSKLDQNLLSAEVKEEEADA